MGCSSGTQSNLEKLRDVLVSLSDLVDTANLCSYQQQELFRKTMKQIEVKCSSVKKKLSLANQALVEKEDIQAFACLNSNYQNQIASLNRKIQGLIYTFIIKTIIDMATVNPGLESAFLI